MLPKPRTKFVLRDVAGGEISEQDDQLGVGRVKDEAIIDQEGFGDDQRRAFVAIHERMVARNAERVAGCERGRVGRAINVEILPPRQCAVEQTLVANALPAAVNRELVAMRRKRQSTIDPAPLRQLLRQFAKRSEATLHDVARDLHLPVEIIGLGLDLELARTGLDRHFLALSKAAGGEQLARNDDPGRIPDGNEFRYLVHTLVITP